MLYPIGYKRNSRYRGPTETIKLKSNAMETKINIETLKKVLITQEEKLISIKNSLVSNKTIQYDFQITKIADTISQINGGF